MKTNLTNIHGSSFLQIGPRRINNINVVYLVSYQIRRTIQQSLAETHTCTLNVRFMIKHTDERHKPSSLKFNHSRAFFYLLQIDRSNFTLNGICFDKLSTILQQPFTYIINGLTFLQSHINMGRRHFVHVEPTQNDLCLEFDFKPSPPNMQIRYKMKEPQK